ncbi:MAG: hypothetical protein C0201_00455 [Caldisphaera sp.]|nr:MAG: hypothetical protein C0201_00455 [Caldisphaera sp.]
MVLKILLRGSNEESLGLFPYKAMILDNVHGFIPINLGEYWILQTPFMRRLHNIKQLGANYLVFPSAKHTRLEHSLGCMHIASRMANKLLNDALSENNSKLCAALFNSCNETAYNSFIQVARLSCLLHDLGHLAFSHMIESGIKNILVYSNEDISLDQNISKKLSKIYSDMVLIGGKVHEFYTYYFIKKLSELASNELANDKNLSSLSSLIEASLASLFPKEKCDELEDLGLSCNAAKIIKSIISNEIADADRLDYLQRDAMATGIVYGNIDIDRLIYGIKLGLMQNDQKDEVPFLTLDMKSMPTLEDIFDARYKMYKSVYFHHKSIALNKSVEKFVNGLADEWDKVKLQLYEDIDIADFLDPKVLSEAIKENKYYFDDNELDSMIKISSNKGSDILKRWALSLLNRRELLPLSLFKRPEQVMIIASQILEKNGKQASTENIKKLIKGFNKHLLNEHIKSISDIDAIKIDYYDEEIINESKINEASQNIFNWKESMYIRGLVQTGSIPVLLVYIYSDSIEDHKKLKNNIDKIRSKAVNELSEIFSNKAKEI